MCMYNLFLSLNRWSHFAWLKIFALWTVNVTVYMQCFLCFACFPKITRNPYVKAYNLRFCVSLGSQPNHQGSSTVCSIFSVALPPVLKEWFSELPIFFFCFLSSLQFSVPKDNRKIGKKPSIHTDPLFLDYKIKRTKLVMTFQ